MTTATDSSRLLPDADPEGGVDTNINSSDTYGTDGTDKADTYRSFMARTFSHMEAGSLRGSIFTLASTAIGAGMLALPLVLKNCGIILGMVLVLFGGFLALFSMALLVEASAKTGLKTYSSLTTGTFGPSVGRFIEVTLVVYCFGAVIAYFVVIGSSLNTVLDAFGVTGFFSHKAADLLILTVVVVLPMSLLRDVSGLRYASIFAIMSMLYIALAILVRGIQNASVSNIVYAKVDLNIFTSTTITFFAFTAHVNVFSVFSELQNPLLRRMKKVMWRSLVLEFLLYGTVAIFGYLTWHDATEGNVLKNYSSTDYMFVVGRMCVGCSLSVAIPINIHPCRANLQALLWKDQQFSLVRHVLITVGLIAPAVLLAIVAPGVSVVFGLLGATCCVIMCYAIPILAYEKIFRSELSTTQRYGLFALLAACIVIGVISIIQNVQSIVNGDSS